MKFFSIITVAGFLCLMGGPGSLAAFAATPVNACYGPATAKVGLIYLHGIDDVSLGHLEKANRLVLERLAASLSIRVALPRGNLSCRPGKLCWSHQSQQQRQSTLRYILEHSKTCLSGRSLRALIGFSNGAYLVNKLFQSCLAEQRQLHFIAVGGMGELSSAPTKITSCGTLDLLVGRSDISRDKVRSFGQRLAKRFPNRVYFESYAGGHHLQEPSLMRTLKRRLFGSE